MLTRRSQQADGTTFQWRLLESYGATSTVESRDLGSGITYIRLANFMRRRKVGTSFGRSSTTSISLRRKGSFSTFVSTPVVKP